jgi:hydroxyacylglutathione hydrolase
MNMKKITDNVFLLEGSSNSYLVNDEKRLLVDASVEVMDKVDIIVLTHCHFDHISKLRKIQDKFKKCKIFAGEMDREHIEKVDDYVLDYMSKKVIKPVKVNYGLKDGDVIKTGELHFQVIETPGHTEGSICLYEPEKKILFSGDTWFGGDSIGRFDFIGGNHEKLMQSLKKLRNLKVDFLCAGH